MQNSAATIELAVASIIAQSFVDWELIIVDDGSQDDSAERVNRFRDSRIRLVTDVPPVRRGLAIRLNQAIDLARGEFIARMDADDVAFPERFAQQIAALRADPSIDLVGAAMLVFADDGRAVGLHPAAPTHEEICARPYRGFYLPHPSWMGKVAWFRRWRYDPAYTKSQDQDLLRRSWRSSRFAALSNPLGGYRQDRISLTKQWKSRYFGVRSIWQAVWRDRKPWIGIVATVAQAARAMVETVAVVTGTERVLLPHRARPISAAQLDRWQAVWRQLKGEVD